MASTYLQRSISSAGSLTTWTFSAWVKLSEATSQNCAIFSQGSSGDNVTSIFFNHDNGAHRLEWRQYQSSYTARKTTNRAFSDKSGWYHIVCQWDSTNGTAGDRMKIYINGERETSFSNSTDPSSSLSSIINSTTGTMHIGTYWNTSSNLFNGCMSHVHFVDGSALAPTVFGETDSTTGEWKIKTSPSYTAGTNGFFILKDGNSVTDQSVNSNNFTVGGGTLTKTEDCPSNVFATLNPLVNIGTTTTYSQGNNTVSTSNANYKVSPSTLAVSSGKWYMEFKAVSGSFGSVDASVGIIQTDTAFSTASQNLNAYPNGYSYGSLGKVRQYNNSDIYTASTYADGDIVGIALDMDNNKLYFHKNGTYQNSGVPTSGSTGTGAVSITSGKEYYIACSTIASGGTKVFSANFGNGYFGTTAVSSAGTNASGIGIFEYDVPANYTSLSTKGLNL